MLKDTEQVIADQEFKRFCALDEREVTRKQYDQVTDALNRCQIALKNQGLTPGQREQYESEEKALTKSREDLKTFMDDIDGTIFGTAPTPSMPDGSEGIDNKLKSWARRRELIKGYIKYKC